MLGKLENSDAAYPAVTLALRSDEVTELIRCLEQLRDGNLEHFHIRCNDFKPDRGIGDIELSLMGPTDNGNMSIDGSPCKE